MAKKRKKRKRPNGCQTCYKAGNGKKGSCWSRHTHAVLERRKADLDAKEQKEG